MTQQRRFHEKLPTNAMKSAPRLTAGVKLSLQCKAGLTGRAMAPVEIEIREKLVEPLCISCKGCVHLNDVAKMTRTLLEAMPAAS
jgi:hypothetical protein